MEARIVSATMIGGFARFLLGACVALMLGCGARTSTIEEEDAGAQSQGGSVGGTLPIAGSPAGGAGFGGSFGGSALGGAGFGGSPLGGAGFGGSFGGSALGGAGFGGAAGVAGVGAFAGFAGTAGLGGGGTAGLGGSAGSGGIVNACRAIAGTACQQCQCTTCSTELVGCFSDFGCALIFACAQRTGCQGLGCYTPGTCQATIDQFGGPFGRSVREGFALETCSASSQNACGCP